MKINTLLKLCAFTVFLGRAYQFYFFGAPFRAILWDESLMSPVVEGLTEYSWFDYATSPAVNQWIESFTKVNAFIFLLAGITCLFWEKILNTRIKRTILGIALILFLLFGICILKDKNYNILQLFELSMQFAAPLLLYFNPGLDSLSNKRNLLFLKAALALAFIPHGIFAMGLIFIPGHFLDMTIKILAINESQATNFLFVVGLIDIVFSVLIFIPKISKYVILYLVFWGFATAIARLVSGYNHNFIMYSFHNYSYLVIFRLSHGILPLLIYIMEKKLIKQQLVPSLNEN
jgi:hypothetical protein